METVILTEKQKNYMEKLSVSYNCSINELIDKFLKKEKSANKFCEIEKQLDSMLVEINKLEETANKNLLLLNICLKSTSKNNPYAKDIKNGIDLSKKIKKDISCQKKRVIDNLIDLDNMYGISDDIIDREMVFYIEKQNKKSKNKKIYTHEEMLKKVYRSKK